jgi:hypothetical protein
MTRPPEAAEAPSWTCSRCEVTARWMPGTIGGGRPAEWTEDGDELYCLACRRANAAEQGLEAAPDEKTNEGKAKVRAAALVEFEIRRDPDRANSVIARACRTSIPAVVRARQRIGIPANS